MKCSSHRTNDNRKYTHTECVCVCHTANHMNTYSHALTHLCQIHTEFFGLSKQKIKCGDSILLAISSRQTHKMFSVWYEGNVLRQNWQLKSNSFDSFKSFYLLHTQTHTERWWITAYARFVIGLDWPECECNIEFGTNSKNYAHFYFCILFLFFFLQTTFTYTMRKQLQCSTHCQAKSRQKEKLATIARNNTCLARAGARVHTHSHTQSLKNFDQKKTKRKMNNEISIVFIIIYKAIVWKTLTVIIIVCACLWTFVLFVHVYMCVL